VSDSSRGTKVLRNFAPGSESSRERKFLGAKVLGTFAPGSESSRERKFLGAKVLGTFAPGSESSIPWYFRSRERKFLGAKVPVTVMFLGRGLCPLPRKILEFFLSKW